MPQWFDNFMSKNMILKWEEKDEKRVLKPEWYLAVETDYKNPVIKDPSNIHVEVFEWLTDLSDMLKDVPSQSRFLSGRRATELYVNGYAAVGGTTDIALWAQKPILDAYVEVFQQHNIVLMRRKSGKLKSRSPLKYHIFKPVTVEEILQLNEKKDEKRGQPVQDWNLEFTRVDTNANMICPEFNYQNHIRIYLHTPAQEPQKGIVCNEDKKSIEYPAEYFRGVPVNLKGRIMYIIDPRYIYTKLKSVIESKEKNYRKHEGDLGRLEEFIGKSDFPLRSLKI